MKEKRKYRRKIVKSKVRIYHPAVDTLEYETKDISNGGICVLVKKDYTDKILVKDNAKVVFLNSEDLALVFNMTVIRISKDEIAMEILNCERNGKVFPVSDLRDALS